jgi:CRISPR-associated protein Csb2
MFMIAFAFTFPAGRYHATPWGQNVNEANVAWPPEPARVLRALIATWWRKADHARFPKTVLDDLIDALAAEPPLFSLPDAVHSHIRTFMPAPTKPPGTLIYDAFFRLDRAAEMIVVWLGVVLSPEQHDLAAHLLERIGYLGRAESWAEGRIANDWDGAFNASPRASGVDVAHGTFPVDLVLPVTPRAWAEFQSSIATAPEKAPGEPRQRSTREGLPERLCDALAVDTSEWQKAGWSSPPPLRRLVYDRPGVGPLPNRRRATTRRYSANSRSDPARAHEPLEG